MDECRHIVRLLAFNRRTSNISLICQCTNVWAEKKWKKIFKILINDVNILACWFGEAYNEFQSVEHE